MSGLEGPALALGIGLGLVMGLVGGVSFGIYYESAANTQEAISHGWAHYVVKDTLIGTTDLEWMDRK